MDFLVLDAFITSVKEDLPMPIDIYDAAVLMAVSPLSALSVSKGGAPVAFPDLLNGRDPASIPRCEGIYSLHRTAKKTNP